MITENIKKNVYFIVLIACFHFANYTIVSNWSKDKYVVLIGAIMLVVYLTILPGLYYLLKIKKTDKRWWNILIPFSLSMYLLASLYPDTNKLLFDLSSIVKILVIALLSVFFIKNIRRSIGAIKNFSASNNNVFDPRIYALLSFKKEYTEIEKKSSLVVATEYASWHYFFLRGNKYPPLNLISAHWSHYLLAVIFLLFVATTAFVLLLSYSAFVGVITSFFVLYNIIVVTTNYKVSRYFSIALSDTGILFNNGFFGGFVYVSKKNIVKVEVIKDPVQPNGDEIVFGRAKESQSIRLSFSASLEHRGFGGQLKQSSTKLVLNMKDKRSREEIMQLLLTISPGIELS